jgi:hypothetical protein
VSVGVALHVVSVPKCIGFLKNAACILLNKGITVFLSFHCLHKSQLVRCPVETSL